MTQAEDYDTKYIQTMKLFSMKMSKYQEYCS